MIRNYFKTALRGILRDKLTSSINIAGLALAMAAALLIYLFVTDELSYDRYHSKADRIYRVTRSFLDQDGVPRLHLATVAPPFGPLLKNDFGEIDRMARTLQFNLVMAIEENGERRKMATEPDAFITEPDLFKIFDIPVLSGSPEKDLERPFTVMLSEKSARKYFESTDVIGKHLKAGRKLDLEVTGVYKDFPAQSHWHPEFLISFSTLNDSTIYGRKALETNWGNNSFSTYLLMSDGADVSRMEKGFPEFIDKHYGTYAKANFGVPANFVASRTTKLFMQKVTDVHLKSHLDDEIEVGGSISNVYLMAVIGIFIVLIACFNFVNLSTARATRRSKEVGLRKALGAFRQQLIAQYLSESFLIALFAMVLSVGFAYSILPWLNAFTQKTMSLQLLSNWPILAGIIAFSIIVGFLAGIYPAFVISSFKPALVLKGRQGSVSGRGGIRKVLVVSQFAISVALLIATAVTIQQLQFLNSITLGYDKDRVVTLPFYSELNDNYESFYNELTKSSSIENVSLSSRIPTGRLLDSQGGVQFTKGDSTVTSVAAVKYVLVDEEFMDTYDIKMAAGRNFSKSIPTDDSLAFIINEATVRMIGWKTNDEGLNQDFIYGGQRRKLIGVVQDFHFESLHEEIVPMIFAVSKGNYNNMSVKLSGGNIQDGLSTLEKVWKSYLPNRPFDYLFTSDRYDKLYEAEQKQGQLFSIFSGIAIFIACLGLFGLATFSTLQRIKEIGIRKVLGASIPGILTLLSREIVILIVTANIIAWPAAWYLMNLWLSGFAYHIEMNLLTYAGAAFTAIFIALLTVSTQTLRAAMTNPAKTLRYE